ncbi:ABC transporter permease [Teichococcus cervicalis]|uniref:ABC transporter, permease protein n=1 Tax=Pseudoroseomonas cervicalis ATCC 49957 TaxID=525371 RepID=D5RGZ3_9PROT|nr:ABC transporter permease [Pseudoroseomonas cervicalis]EFH13425.1 ABC transporter, permease protein [Pseudoroseomonas cervicalis ATCC 49957]WBV45416.1 ABC transporter permease [Pseudoroseomonas cervicalis]
MIRYILRRLLLLVPVLVGLSMLVFAIARLLPGDPVRLAAGPNASAADVASVAREFGLDQPLPLQYWHYVTGLLQGDWGVSIFSRRPVIEDLAAYLPATLELVLAAMLLAVAIGIPAGLMAAVYRDRWPDFLSRAVSLGAISMPRFFLGLLFQLGFAMWLGWLPLSGRFPLTEDPPATITGLLTLDALLTGQWHAFGIALQHLALPAIAMSLSPLATITRMMRASTIEVLQQDYVTTERALGLSARLILFKYVLKNAVSATLTVIGLYFGWLLGGTVLVETVFDWPGLGLYATQAVLTQDFMPIIGVTLCIGTLFVLVNLLVDLLYGLLNPRVRLR